jgi:hypothetical protein
MREYGGDPAIVAAIGMLAGFCGTLMTPMAANYNIVPAALLELGNRNGVIREQIGTAIPLLFVNTCLITSWPSADAHTSRRAGLALRAYRARSRQARVIRTSSITCSMAT